MVYKMLENLQQFQGLIMPVLLIVSFLIEKLPNKIKPYTRFIKYVAKIINVDIYEKLDTLQVTVTKNRDDIKKLSDDINVRFDEYDTQCRELEAGRMRQAIENFAENIKMGRRYSCKQFENILKKIDDYESFCEQNGIKNGYIKSAADYIEKKHTECAYNEKESEE